MNDHDIRQIDFGEEERIFTEALAIEEPAARMAFLQRRCGINRVLLERLKKLFAAHDTDPSFLENTARFQADGPDPFGTIQEDVIGNYRLERLLGSGSFGDVYEAEQSEPVKRRVALKILKAGLEGGTLLARFEVERQTLAVMEHPHIARLLDAGMTAQRRPWFAMELIDGPPLTGYADTARLTVRERIGLFLGVCAGVQHAHQKAVIHRDLKPANVLVSQVDTLPTPKIIDFGIAKAIAGEGLDFLVLTHPEQVIGTPLYMSPEQTEFGAVGIDTRTDIYALGVLLYELLSGTTPFPRERFQGTGFEEIRRIIREEEPLRPSRRIASLSEPDGLAVSTARRSDPAKLARALSGDLDWIVMKCLEKDRNRRYQSAGELASDLGRYLNHEAIEARPPSRLYRWSKLARQHRGLIAATGTIILVLMAATAFSFWQAVQANRARAAEARQGQRTEEALQAVRIEREVAVGINDFLLRDLLGQADILNQSEAGTRTRDLGVVELLDRAAARLERNQSGLQKVEAALRSTIGQAYMTLGRYEEAGQQLDAALEISQRQAGPNAPETLEILMCLGRLRLNEKRLDEVPALLEQLKRISGENNSKSHPELPRVLDLEAGYLLERGRSRDAKALMQKVLAMRRATLPPDDPGILRSLHFLASLNLQDGEYRLAEQQAREVYEGYRRQIGLDHPATLGALKTLANSLSRLDRLDEAGKLYRTAMEHCTRLQGDQHPSTFGLMNDFALFCEQSGQHAEAEQLYQRACAGYVQVLGEHHPATLLVRNNLATFLLQLGRMADAEPMLLEVLEHQRARLEPRHRHTVLTLNNIAFMYQSMDRLEEALPYAVEAMEGAREGFSRDSPEFQQIVNNLVMIQLQTGDSAACEKLLRELVEEFQDHSGDGSAEYCTQLCWLAICLIQQERFSEAEGMARHCLEIRNRISPTAWKTMHVMTVLGCALSSRKKYKQAEPLLLKGCQGMLDRPQPISPVKRLFTRWSLEWLIRHFEVTGNATAAEEWRGRLQDLPELLAEKKTGK